MEVYVKKYIRTADDLPKEIGNYLTEFGWLNFNGKWQYPHKDNVTYLRPIDWYLQPIELPTEEEVTTESTKRFTSNTGYYDAVKAIAFEKGVNWLLSKLK